MRLPRDPPARRMPEKSADAGWHGTHAARPATIRRCRKPVVDPRARPEHSNADATPRLPGFLGAKRVAIFHSPKASRREYVILPIDPLGKAQLRPANLCSRAWKPETWASSSA